MEFKNFLCAKCHHMGNGTQMSYFQECSHFFCHSCITNQSTCSKCNKGSSINASSDDLLMSVLNFVSDIYSTFIAIKNDTLPVNEETSKVDSVKDTKPFLEPKAKIRKLKLLNQTAGMSSPALRRTPRTAKLQQTNSEPEQEVKPEFVVPPARKRRRKVAENSSVLEETILDNDDKKVLLKRKNCNEDLKILKSPVNKNANLVHDQNIPETTNGNSENVKILTSPGIPSKKNTKGETPLHIAVKKKKLDLVEDLLKNGADPNVQDFAGWTPLHDAVTLGLEPIVNCLLKHGALVDIPGYENDTALHIAVEKIDNKLVGILLKHGANPGAKNLFGLTPIAVAEKSGNKELIKLFSSPAKSSNKPKVSTILPTQPISLFINYLKGEQRKIAQNFAKQFKFKVENDFYKASCVVISNPSPTIDWSLAQVMAKGSHIISLDWCEKSLTTGTLQPIEDYPIYPEWLPGLHSAQTNSNFRRPGLFSGCQIKLGSSPQMLKNARSYMWNDTAIDLNDLSRFLQAADGKLINRMPDPEDPFNPNTAPYHFPPGPMERCSQIVIYFPGLWEPALKFNMAHVKCLPIQWLMDCILSFEVKGETDCYFTP